MIRKTGLIPLLLAPLGLLCYPFLICSIVLNELVRIVVSFVLFLRYHDTVQLVSEGADGFWGYKKPGSTRNVLLYLLSPKDGISAEGIAKFYREQIQAFREKGERRYEKFERIMTTSCGYICWKKANNFNIRNHIRTLEKATLYRAKDVQQMLTELGEDMEESKPQWELIIVPRYDDGSGEVKSMLLCRFLHAYMDGISAIMLFKERITPTMEYTVDPLKFRIVWWKKVLFYLSTFIYGPFNIMLFPLERFIQNFWILREQDKTQKKRKFYTWANSKPISDGIIRKIRTHGNKASVTNVITTAFASACSKTLARSRLLDELVVSELVAFLPYPDPAPQNRFAMFAFPVSTRAQEPYDKLRDVKRDCMKSMLGPEVLISYYMFKLSGRFPAFFFPFFLYGSQASVVLSNAPFSKGRVEFPNGSPVLDMGAFTPHPNDLGLSLTTSRYGDEIKFFAVADSTWLSQEELTKLIDQIPFEILEMAESATATATPATKSPTTTTTSSRINPSLIDDEDGLPTFGNAKGHLKSKFNQHYSPYIR